REVWPLDAAAARQLSGEPTFWAIALLAALPLLFLTLSEPNQQLTAFAIFFAVIWGLIFRYSVIPGSHIGWGWLLIAFFASGIVGMPVAWWLEGATIPQWIYSSHPFALLFSDVFQTGIYEELCKALP